VIGRDPSRPRGGADRVPHGARGLRAKRVVEAALAAVLLVLALPLLAILALAIVLESRGPILYRCPRVGYGGRTLWVLKLRKMRADSTGPAVTRDGDERLTRVGRFMRAAHLDELPQLWQVMRGQMALVGPRPEDPAFIARHSEEYAAILSVRPGLTGLVQLAFTDEAQAIDPDDPLTAYCELLLPRKVDLDVRYVEERNVWLDLRLLLWTPVAMTVGLPAWALASVRDVVPEPDVAPEPDVVPEPLLPVVVEPAVRFAGAVHEERVVRG
jgi:lipopolysaccharide/colanic/teichoic acid biosynthesis glycosyltransferase